MLFPKSAIVKMTTVIFLNFFDSIQLSETKVRYSIAHTDPVIADGRCNGISDGMSDDVNE